ncbi:hypothetical protein ABBQ38_000513 [Trebouxia sp. C0009 RCD-2024]
MLSSQLLKVFAVICTLNFAQAHELTQGDDKSPAPLVQVNFYGEALCPYCAKFIDMVAAQMHYNGVMNTTSFRYIPYGNAQDTKDGVQCQHGPRECELNRILNCAVHLNYDQNKQALTTQHCMTVQQGQWQMSYRSGQGRKQPT